MSDSDSIYHRLFSDPRMVEGLVWEFAPREVAAGLDFRRLQRVNAKFHPGRRSARQREGDVIWRLPMRKGGDVHLYLLIEFQSRGDHWMAVRTGVYQGLLWQQVIVEQQLRAGARVPPLLLLVLYNGEPRWKAAGEARDLVALPSDSSLWCWQPQSRYCLLDIGSFPKDELARSPSLVALLFRVEQQYSPVGFDETMDELIAWFREHEGHERLQALFAELIRDRCARHGIELPKSLNLLEMKTMFLSQMDTWKREFAAEVTSKAKAEGKAEALIDLLAERFGPVGPPWLKLIQGADLATLDLWLKRIIVAPDLSSVFNPPC